MSRTLRAAIIGLGVGEAHIEGYRSHPDCEVTMLCDFDEEKRVAATKKYPELVISADANEILDNPDIDVVSIASYDNYHHAQIMRAIESGKHIFVEKPLCLSEEEAKDIRGALDRASQLKMSSNLILRMAPRFNWLREKIAAGELGQLFNIEGDYNYGRIHKIVEGWRGDLPFYSAVYGGGVHLIDLMLWLTGDRVVEVSAYGNNIVSRSSGFRFNDMIIAALRFHSGMVGKLGVNFGCVYPHFHPLTVYGDKATFVNSTREHGLLYTSRDREKAPEKIKEAYPGAAKGDIIYSFIESIQNGGDCVVDADAVFNAMSVCFAIERAATSGTPQTVNYL